MGTDDSLCKRQKKLLCLRDIIQTRPELWWSNIKHYFWKSQGKIPHVEKFPINKRDVNFGSDKTKNEASNANRHMSFSMYYTNEATVMPISQTFFSLHMFRENCFSLVSRMVPHMWLRSESRCLRIEWNLDLRGLEIHTEHLNSHPRDFSGWRLLPAVTVFHLYSVWKS